MAKPKFPKMKLKKPSMKMLKTNASSFMGMKITTPAIIALVSYIILALIIVLPFEFPVYDERTGQDIIIKYDLSQRLIILLLMSIPVALSVYSINCMLAGNCVLWSYIVSFLVVFWVVLFVITAILYTFKNS